MPPERIIASLLMQLRGLFYKSDDRGFHRDRLALTKAISRYGYACHARGWQFDPGFVMRDISGILRSVYRTYDRAKYLPIYLEAAVDRHVRLRAEELQAEARKIEPRITKLMAGMPSPARSIQVRNLTSTEVMATVYRELAKHGKARAKARHASRQSAQLKLL